MRRLSSAYLLAALLLAAIPQAQNARAQDAASTPPSAQPQSQEPSSDEDNKSRLAECSWLGQRIVSLLWRDDVNTAREQTRFYEMFGCPSDHLSVAFRCVIEQSQSQPDQNDLNARAYACWMNPGTVQPKE